MTGFPVNIYLNKSKVLIVGGGKVAYRKAMVILPFVGGLTIVAPIISSSFDSINDNKITFIRDEYSPKHLDDIRLCIAATDNLSLNDRIVDDCNKRAILCNSVTNSEYGHIAFPCFFTDSDIVISVSTSGNSPMLAKKLRDKLKEDYSKRYYLINSLLGGLRDEYNNKLPSHSKGAFWSEVVDLALSGDYDLSNFPTYIEELYNKFYI
jgi:precorrin-2 dehydrogenase/sirohydrochlorin ferrochelatase